jgi:hypothetical protein
VSGLRRDNHFCSSVLLCWLPFRWLVGALAVSEPLPELLDARKLAAELGVSRAAAEALMRKLPTVQIEGLRKVYVRREDVVRYLESRTFAKDEVPA